MKKSQASITAQGIAFLRAYETSRPPGERICDDPLARRLMHPFYYWIGRAFAAPAERKEPGTVGFMVARCRYIDDYLLACLAEGIQQVVILGAGLDSRAFRLPELQQGVRVFEVDQPATQENKKRQLQRILGSLPRHVEFAAIDLDVETLDRLVTFGYDPQLKTLFVWEGVVHYLSAAAVDQTLAWVRKNSGAGSSIIFDYLYSEAFTGEHKRAEIRRQERSSRWSGEALTFSIAEGQAVEFLRSRGYTEVVNVTADDLKRLYFTGVNANRAVAPVYAIVHGRTGGQTADVSETSAVRVELIGQQESV
jgi:methyltransferase (TIGR00027 family)